jgi:hypothetical protein
MIDRGVAVLDARSNLDADGTLAGRLTDTLVAAFRPHRSGVTTGADQDRSRSIHREESLTRMWTIAQPTLTAAELFRMEQKSSENLLRGWVVASVDGAGCVVEYEVTTDLEWRTSKVYVTLQRGTTRRLEIEHDGHGRWAVDGVSRPDLDGCLDVDLGITPSTNTLPIRRLTLDIGTKESLAAAWVRFPDLVVEVLPQSYERLASSVHRYRSDSFEADLKIDPRGVVLRYGTDLWQVVDAS